MAIAAAPVPAAPTPAAPTLAAPVPAAAKSKKANNWIMSLAYIALIALGWYGVKAQNGASWVIVALAMLMFFLLLGWGITGRPLGILVSERNVMSLSRFQVVLWTLVILSAYTVIVTKRIFAGMPNALDFPMDWHLWALMGISTASLVGTPLLLESKKDENPSEASLDKAAKKTAIALKNEEPTKTIEQSSETIKNNRQGTLYANESPADARFADIFQGDEIANTAYVDVAKLQMFAFTLIVAGSFAHDVFHVMYGPVSTLTFPKLSEGLVALLGISHAGYLGSKTADHTPKAG